MSNNTSISLFSERQSLRVWKNDGTNKIPKWLYDKFQNYTVYRFDDGRIEVKQYVWQYNMREIVLDIIVNVGDYIVGTNENDDGELKFLSEDDFNDRYIQSGVSNPVSKLDKLVDFKNTLNYHTY